MFDTPVYKILAPNDTGAARGHQAGIVIPAAIEDFFPDVIGTITGESPTADVPVAAELVVDGRSVARVETRYQYQTWGGTRSPERRLTNSLGPLRNAANPHDMVLFSRDPEKPDLMKLTLLRAGSAEYEEIIDKNPTERWGVVPGLPQPVSNRDIRNAQDAIEALNAGEFALFDNERPVLETPVRKKARNSAFRKNLIRAYGTSCMASGDLLETPDGLFNLDAAHIVPVESGGSDDVRNGLLFGKDVHWAFDKGLFSIDDDYEIIVSTFATTSVNCELVKRLDGNTLVSPVGPLIAHLDALRWHRDNRFLG
ncbi:hypothetical protein DYI23_09670 [Roseibium polysiphoniae]|uniref:Restriction endonuclease n=1 Tax=Roseibium polysiphoniae TaxID=2571221 RepID=A0A944GSN2_9HYPH|nr:HNH endonuclease [Roseibium polysiphoniae]MBS8260484.1 hypothetical protein [Roseibium polysiphoniae]